MRVGTETDSIKYQEKWVRGMSHPTALLSYRASSAPHTGDIQAAEPQHTVSVVTTHNQSIQSTGNWQLVPATVCEDHIVPNRPAKRVVIRVRNAPVDSDVCFDTTNNILVKHLRV